MVSLYSKPDANDFERRKDDCASQREEEEYGQSDHGDTLPGRETRLGEFGEKQLSDGPQPENDVCNMRNLRRKEAGRQVQDPGTPTFGGRQ